MTLLAATPSLREAVVRALGGDAIHTRLWGLMLVLVALGGLTVGRRIPGVPSAVGLLAAQAALILALPHLLTSRPDDAPEHVGLWLALGGLAFLILNFAYAFAFTYPYTLQTFKGMGLPVVLIAALLAALPALLRPVAAHGPAEVDGSDWVAWIVATLALVTVAAAAARPRSVEPLLVGSTIRAGTYNIHYGYNKPWRYSLEEQARTVEASGGACKTWGTRPDRPSSGLTLAPNMLKMRTWHCKMRSETCEVCLSPKWYMRPPAALTWWHCKR